ncbi:hypothetical protein, partial [Aureimonas sp. AU4]|uniref:hypothetical protein n=1 Tax=Aureimonas sp. AU4 TaxID=1638163 RepID=UPI001AEBE05E
MTPHVLAKPFMRKGNRNKAKFFGFSCLTLEAGAAYKPPIETALRRRSGGPERNAPDAVRTKGSEAPGMDVHGGSSGLGSSSQRIVFGLTVSRWDGNVPRSADVS